VPHDGIRRRRLSPTSPRSRILNENESGVTLDLNGAPVPALINQLYPIDCILP
jgi:hypothetical protein